VFKYFRSSTKYKYIQSVFAGVGVAPCNSEIRNLTSCWKLFIYLAVCEKGGFGLTRSQEAGKSSQLISSQGFKITIKFLMNFSFPTRDFATAPPQNRTTLITVTGGRQKDLLVLVTYTSDPALVPIGQLPTRGPQIDFPQRLYDFSFGQLGPRHRTKAGCQETLAITPGPAVYFSFMKHKPQRRRRRRSWRLWTATFFYDYYK